MSLSIYIYLIYTITKVYLNLNKVKFNIKFKSKFNNKKQVKTFSTNTFTQMTRMVLKIE